jgi:hypothetical protein
METRAVIYCVPSPYHFRHLRAELHQNPVTLRNWIRRRANSLMGLAWDRSAVADASYLTSDLDFKISAHLCPSQSNFSNSSVASFPHLNESQWLILWKFLIDFFSFHDPAQLLLIPMFNTGGLHHIPQTKQKHIDWPSRSRCHISLKTHPSASPPPSPEGSLSSLRF